MQNENETNELGEVGPYGGNPPWSIEDALMSCGMTLQRAQGVATQFFENSFISAKDKPLKEIEATFKTLVDLPARQGGMKYSPAEKRYIIALNYWIAHQWRMARDPRFLKFPPERSPEIRAKAKTHDRYIENYETISTAAKPEKLTKDVKWEDWYPSFKNYLRTIPGRYGVPLAYVIRDNEAPTMLSSMDYLDEYIDRAQLSGEAFITDMNQVHVYIVNLISGNEEAEAILRVNGETTNGRKDWIALKQHYEGQGMFAIKTMEAQKHLSNLFYCGEKPPQMTWTKFERTLNATFIALGKDDGAVYSDIGKLRTLLDKIRCDWLSNLKALLSLKAQERPPACTYDQALLAFRTEVHRKFPPNASPAKTRRTIAELQGEPRQGRGYQGRGYARGRGRGRGRGGRGRGRGRGSRPQVDRRDIKRWTIANGREIDYHPSFNFPPDIYNNFTKDQYEQLKRDRNDYRNRQSGANSDTDSIISAVVSGTKRSFEESVTKMVQAIQRSTAPATSVTADTTDRSAISQITTGTTSIMGGRREQEELRRQKGPGR